MNFCCTCLTFCIRYVQCTWNMAVVVSFFVAIKQQVTFFYFKSFNVSCITFHFGFVRHFLCLNDKSMLEKVHETCFVPQTCESDVATVLHRFWIGTEFEVWCSTGHTYIGAQSPIYIPSNLECLQIQKMTLIGQRIAAK